MSISLIQTITLSSDNTGVTFNNIPQDGEMLLLTVSGQGIFPGTGIVNLQSDNVNSTIYTSFTGNSSILSGLTSTGDNKIPFWGASNTGFFGTGKIYIFSYSSSTGIKPVLFESHTASSSTGDRRAHIGGGNILKFTPMTSFSLFSGNIGFKAGSTFSLYKIKRPS